MEEADLEGLAVTEPYKSVVVDVAALKANRHLPDSLVVTGVVYEVATGGLDIVVPAGRLREPSDG